MKLVLSLLLWLTMVMPIQAQDKTLKVTTLPSGTERRAAVIIANQNYRFNPLDLSKTYNDADDMKAALERLGFKVLVFSRDLSRSALNRELLQLETTLRGYDVAFFYYSGHGGSYGQENFLLPTDIEPLSDARDVQTFGISLNRVYEAFTKAQVKTGIVVSDACRGFGMGKSTLAPGMVIPANNPAGTFTLFATRQGDIAKENLQGRNSYFTQELLKHLETPNLTLNQIYYRTRQGVKAATAHFPRPQEPGIANELDDEFVLIQKIDDTPPPPGPKTRQYLDLPFAQMVYIPGGTFQMGDTRREGDKDEKPVHTVTVSSFLMGKYEVTQRQWEAVMGNNPSYFKDCPDCPVEQVSWDDVQAFLQQLNARTGGTYRLPTEAEWEYAAGGGSGTRTRFGNGRDVLDPAEANFDAREAYKETYSVVGEWRRKVVPVGSFRANALGLHDMTGNVYEWCADWYADYSHRSQHNPTGPAATKRGRVLRGGCWLSNPQFRGPVRNFGTPSTRNSYSGFRVVSEAQ
ncbi:SUMF1/EgtB/PvdO family nonheme iron enzyme [Spirosoma fluviale]|uniref:Formylglycine-generating enzyme, required for sulfatase activity, contains SUMF1/FGE domain n=1 Tax=Spirosoma fluviale TaxID=1597977 RepID=A0A286GLN8_9BACT|nr:SUMF1/EgtB/PvdO family nonheme iron enzyme [Spirosoma fluviale]SOD96428.1 Formylglycine-generating enzyme, required for sulfatase activity, contains SUMF1/FGE domain [Spirosoma fluviale]